MKKKTIVIKKKKKLISERVPRIVFDRLWYLSFSLALAGCVDGAGSLLGSENHWQWQKSRDDG